MTTVGVLIGPLPRSLSTRRVARLLQEVTPASARLVELDFSALPHHAPQTDVPAPADALAWKRTIAELDALIVLTPAHERSIPGCLKNALDWAGGAVAPNALIDLPVVIGGLCDGELPRFAAIQHLRTVMQDAGARMKSQPEHVLALEPGSFDAQDHCHDDHLRTEARDLLAATVGHAAHQARARIVDAASMSDDVVTEVLSAGPGPLSPASGLPVVVAGPAAQP